VIAGFMSEWIILALNIIGSIAAFISAMCLIAVAVLIILIYRDPPEDWH